MTGVVHSEDVIAAVDDATALTELNAHGKAGDHFGWVETSLEGSRYVADGIGGPLFDWIVAVAWSDDGARFCYAGVQSGRVTVLADHEPGPVVANFSAQAPPTFSPDARTLIYGGGQSSFHLYIDHVRQLDELAPVTPAFSADGSRLGWVAQKRSFLSPRQWVVIDDVAGPRTHGVATDVGIRFSPGGRHVAYVAKFDKGVSLVRDEVVGPPFQGIAPPAFSPDGERFAAMVFQGNRQMLSVDGRPPEFEALTSPVFSPDGRQLAWGARDGERFAMVVDGVPLRVADDLRDTYRWSPDGHRLAFHVRAPEGWRLISGDGMGQAFDATSGYYQSPADLWTYATYRGKGPIFRAQRENRWAVVIDDEVGPWFHALGSIVLSADGEHLAYIAGSEDVHEVILDGATVSRQRQTDADSLVLSPDGKHAAYLTVRGGSRHLALDDTSGPVGYDSVSYPFFTPDGGAHAWAVRGSKVYRLSASPS